MKLNRDEIVCCNVVCECLEKCLVEGFDCIDCIHIPDNKRIYDSYSGERIKWKMKEEKQFVDNHRIHCSKCGRFVGKDGFIDVFYDDYMGSYEEGYSLCANCLKKKEEQNENKQIS